MKQINFLRHQPNPAVLLTGIIFSVGISLVLIGSMLSPTIGQGTKATIADTLQQSPLATPTSSALATPEPITDTTVTATTLGPTGATVRYIEAPTGRIFEVDPESHHISLLSDQKLPNRISTVWSSDGRWALHFFSSSTGIVATETDYQTGTTTPIGTRPLTGVFSPDRQQIALLESGPDQNAITISSHDSSAPRTLFHTRSTPMSLDWPQEGALALESMDSQKEGSISLIGLDGSFTPLVTNLPGLQYQWSVHGSYLLYSYEPGGVGIRLAVLNLSTGQSTPLSIATSAQKCAWQQDDSVLICGVPSHISTIDDVVRISLADGGMETVYHAASNLHINISNPILTSTGFLVFTNLFDQKLYVFRVAE